MALYKERGVNPAGCFLPMLVQMPIWFALFRVLREPEVFIPASSRLATDLGINEHLHFLGMDVKLSPSDAFSTLSFGGALPYLILLAIVVGTGFLQQKLTAPSSSSSNNPQAATAQKITKILPIFFGVISFVWPAGLNLYFATSNLFRTGQQLLIFKIDGRPEPPGAASEPVEDPEAERSAPKKPQGSAKKRNRRRRR
jgi:YidC/Oxa1 family membrane protein insertase